MAQHMIFTRQYMRRFNFTVGVWLFGLIVASVYCKDLESFSLPYADWVPAIAAYSEATANSCVSGAVWKFSWSAGPFVMLWLFFAARHERIAGANSALTVVMLILFAFSIWSCVFGLYGPYSESAGGRWSQLFRENVVATVALSAAMWVGFWLSSVFLFLFIKR